MNQPMQLPVGHAVFLNCPENPYLHNSPATIESVESWGYRVRSEAAASGSYRATFEEVSLFRVEGTTSKEDTVVETDVRTIKAQGYTGNVCPTCGGCRMRRNGTCELCEDCGSTSGCS